MLAIDWSHNKGLATFNGKTLRTEDKGQLLKRLRGESITAIKSNIVLKPQIVLEDGCPLSLAYYLSEIGCEINVIDNHATEDYRKEHNIEKTDENDAKIIYQLANNGARLRKLKIDETILLVRSY